MNKVKTLVNQLGGWSCVYRHIPGLKLAMDCYPRQVPCPKTHQGNTVFRLTDEWERTGKAFHNGEGCLADGLNVISFCLGVSIKDAADEILAITGGDVSSISKRELNMNIQQETERKAQYCSEEKREQRLKKLQELQMQAQPAFKSKEVIRYLHSRGIMLTSEDLMQFNDTLGFVPSLKYYCTEAKSFIGSFPTLLGVFKDKLGFNLTMHRIYLESEGNGKAPVSNPKKLMSPPDYMTGGAFRLGEPMPMPNGGYYIGVTEGIETALALFYANHLPCWSLYSDTVLKNFEPGSAITHVGIWADREPSGAGLSSAQELMKKLKARGIKVQIYYPQHLPHLEKEDWLDVLNHNPELIPNFKPR